LAAQSCDGFFIPPPAGFSRKEEQRAIDALLEYSKISINNTIIQGETVPLQCQKMLSIIVDDVGTQIGEYNGLPFFFFFFFFFVTKGWNNESLKRVNHWLSLARDSGFESVPGGRVNTPD
jgi:hypothetical protein